MKRGHSTKEILVRGSDSSHASKSPQSGHMRSINMATASTSTAKSPPAMTKSATAAPRRTGRMRHGRTAAKSTYQQRTGQRDNPTQQLIKQAVDFLIEQLKQGKSETLTVYLSAMARFHSYSFSNILAIVHSRPGATRV